MKYLSGLKLDCCYEYMNRYTSGFQGAFIAGERLLFVGAEERQEIPDRSGMRLLVRRQPVATDITDPFGKLMEKAGRARDGGSFGIAWATSQCGTG
jgi:putative spermidine/putrescine transport system substrate-binding protein